MSGTQQNWLQGAPPPSTPLKSHFWADWDSATYSAANQILRKDTRIYWKPQTSGTVGKCVGTFYGENPGSAKSLHGLKHSGYSPLVDRAGKPGDPTLQLILDTWIEAARIGAATPQDSDYIEVLNLYYFRNSTSLGSIAAWKQCGGASIYSQAVSPTSRFVLLGWGKKPNQTKQAAAAIALIAQLPNIKILIPDSKANLTICASLNAPVSSFPAMPSYFNSSPVKRRPLYVANVAQGF